LRFSQHHGLSRHLDAFFGNLVCIDISGIANSRPYSLDYLNLVDHTWREKQYRLRALHIVGNNICLYHDESLSKVLQILFHRLDIYELQLTNSSNPFLYLRFPPHRRPCKLC